MQPSHPYRSLPPRERLATARLYLCTDARREKGDLAKFAEAALAGGVDIIQLRDKGSPGEAKFGPMEAKAELGALAELKAAARRHDALVAVNDRADIALASGADVLHLGQGDLPPWYARRILGPEVVIGRSTHNRAQAGLAAIDEHIDYFCTGPVWTTPTKPGRQAADWIWCAPPPTPTRPGPGSRSAVWTALACRSCWQPGPTALSWCERSPKPVIRRPRPENSRPRCSKTRRPQRPGPASPVREDAVPAGGFYQLAARVEEG